MVQVAPRASTNARQRPVPATAPPVMETVDEEQHPRRYAVELPFDPSLVPYLALMLVGLVLRLWGLGDKALHHDESLHALYSWYLYQGRGYVHDPMMHGPLLFEGNALMYLLFGASDFTARLVPALLGVMLIGLPWLLRHELGRSGAVATALLFTISPTYLYFSRFIRHDIYVDVFTLLLVAGAFRYLATGGRAWFYAAIAGATLLFATKEDFYISGFIPFTFLLGVYVLGRGAWGQAVRFRVRELGWQPWAIGVAVFLAVNLLLYTTLFTNLRGLCTAFWAPPGDSCGGAKGALQYWLDQQDVSRGGQPWFYYLMLLGLYEFLPGALAVASLFLVRGRSLFFWFCVYWAGVAFLIYSWAGEKMPWMLPQVALPLVLLAGRLLGQWAEAGWGRRALSPRGLATAGLVVLVAFAGLAWVGLGAARAASPVDVQGITLQRLALTALMAVIAGVLVRFGSRWGSTYLKPGIVLGILAIGFAAYVRTALAVTYDHPDVPVEPLIYVQSTPDDVWITREIERLGNQMGRGKDVGILLDNGWADGVHESVAWPFEWYLRDYKNKRYFTKTIDSSLNLADYPAILVMSSNQDPIRDQLRDYNGQKYRLNAWFPEDYKQFAGDKVSGLPLPTLKLDQLWQTLQDPANRLKLVKFLVYREPPNELGSRDVYFYVRKDIPQVGPAPAGGAGSPNIVQASQAREAVAQPQADGSIVYGRSPSGTSVLVDPKNVAVGPDGKFYVAEGRPGRITVFNPDGSIARSIGSQGAGDGQFQEPWGVAVAPNGDLYVADTWNHRIQRFDASGNFVQKWGRMADTKGQVEPDQGAFWGPRSIAVSAQGEVYVSDTGNKRIEVFSADGKVLRAFGGEGSEPGQFREPVGLALDRTGRVYVADTWNQRVQWLDGQGKPLGSFPISGWEGQSVTNKPYLAVDDQGRVLVTQPDSNRATLMNADGSVQRQFQALASGSAVGAAIANGRVYVADPRTGVIVAYPLP